MVTQRRQTIGDALDVNSQFSVEQHTNIQTA